MGSIKRRIGIQIGQDREYIGPHIESSKLNRKHIGNVYDYSKTISCFIYIVGAICVT